MRRQWMRAAACLAAAAGLWTGILAQTIHIERYITRNAQGGVGLDANYDLGDDWDPDCCDPADVRWIQKISLRDGAGDPKSDVPGYPHSDFIDPEPTQPGGPWDNDPWYNVTYNNAGRTGGIQGGAGRWMSDYPGGWGPFGAMSFNAETLVVCTHLVNHTLCLLGGFSWGFNVAADGTITRNPLAQLADSNARRQAFNNALDQTEAFRPWDMVPCEPDCPDLEMTVPEPASLAALTLSMAALALRRRKGSAK